MSNDDTVLFFTPSLVATLHSAEQKKGKPLRESEVLQIRDQSTCVAIPSKMLPAMIEERGYADIDPYRCWEEWQAIRVTLVSQD